MNPENHISQNLPRYPESMWRDTANLPSYPTLDGNHDTDVAVVGGGLTGITTAYLLSKAGYRVTLLEAGALLNGTTGFTTAKITAQHGMFYNDLISHFGEENARLYYESNTQAMNWIISTAEELGISCGMKREAAYLYSDAGDDKTLKQLEKEFKAYEKLGIPGQWQDHISLPIIVGGAIKLPDQARFHPLQYLEGLLQAFSDSGGVIYEHTVIAENVEKDGNLTLFTEKDHYRITCRHAVSASHFPFYDGGAMYFSRLYPERSYVLAIEPETEFLGGMYLSASQPTRSLRAAEWEGKNLVLVGGESHKTGNGICTFGHYENLEKFAGLTLGIKSIPYRWSAQDLITLDNVPYIGKSTDEDEIYIATGYKKWGMTSSTVAALLISDQIQRKDNSYTDLYDPSRFKANPSIKNFITLNAGVAKDLVGGKIEFVHKKPSELGLDEGAIVRHDGKRAGGYRDPEGKLHLVDTTCTHMGCEVEWNDGERSWDCPCHGSRFSYDGKVFEGPASTPLTKLDPEE